MLLFTSQKGVSVCRNAAMLLSIEWVRHAITSSLLCKRNTKQNMYNMLLAMIQEQHVQ